MRGVRLRARRCARSNLAQLLGPTPVPFGEPTSCGAPACAGSKSCEWEDLGGVALLEAPLSQETLTLPVPVPSRAGARDRGEEGDGDRTDDFGIDQA